MIIFYRYSDGAQPGALPKHKLPLATKENCFRNFLAVFPPSEHIIFVIADNVSPSSLEFLKGKVPSEHIVCTDYKSGALSFLHSVRLAISLSIPKESIIYFVEDDYIHFPKAAEILTEGINLNPCYISLYDHPDKYMNPSQTKSQIFVSKSCHWRTTPSTTMTFATTKQILEEDWEIYWEYCETGYPYDHEMFMALGQKRGRILMSCIPGFATHVEVAWLSPFRDWDDILKRTTS